MCREIASMFFACCSVSWQIFVHLVQDKEYYPNIRRCLVSGFFMQVACLESEKRAAYSMLREGQEVILHPSTSLGHRPEWLVFHELSLSSKLFVKTGWKLRCGRFILQFEHVKHVNLRNHKNHFSLNFSKEPNQQKAGKMFTLIRGTQIRPEWLLDVAPRGYFDAAKISEKCSARNKLDRVLTRRFSQDGPWYAHLTLKQIKQKSKIQAQAPNRRLLSICSFSFTGIFQESLTNFYNHTQYSSIFHIWNYRFLCLTWLPQLLHILQGVMPIFELTLYRACMEGAKTQNTDSSLGVLRSRPTKRNERKTSLRAQLWKHQSFWDELLDACPNLKAQACITCFFTLYDLVWPCIALICRFENCLSKLPVCSSSSGTWERRNLCLGALRRPACRIDTLTFVPMFSTSTQSTPGLRIANLNSLYSLNSDGEKRENLSPCITSASAVASVPASPRARRRQTLKRAKSYGAKVRDHNKDSMAYVVIFRRITSELVVRYNLKFHHEACVTSVTFMLCCDKCLFFTTCPSGCWGFRWGGE